MRIEFENGYLEINRVIKDGEWVLYVGCKGESGGLISNWLNAETVREIVKDIDHWFPSDESLCFNDFVKRMENGS